MAVAGVRSKKGSKRDDKMVKIDKANKRPLAFPACYGRFLSA